MKISLLGITGKMGHHLAEIIAETPDLRLVGAVTSATNPRCGQDIQGMEITANPENAFSDADLLIDFSTPQALPTHLEYACHFKKPLVIGTTGLDHSHYKAIDKASITIPILQAANTSIGITILAKIVREAAKQLGLDYDIEVVETHHRQKIDSPSGTALSLGKAAALGRNADFDQVKVTERQGKRRSGDIGFAVMRGGGVFGEHAVRFLGDDEIIEFAHTSLNRRLFAKGALQAARWLINQKSGLYTMQDIIDDR